MSDNTDKPRETKRWFAKQKSFSGELQTVILHQDDKPGPKSSSGSPTGYVGVIEVLPDHYDLTLSELEDIYGTKVATE